MSRKNFSIFGVALMVLSSLMPCVAFALDEQELDTFSQNNILFYDPSETSCSGGASVCDTDLPEETVKKLESAGVKEKAEANMERYKYAEEKTGLPWQAIAALHYREAGMSSDGSISNGQKLTKSGCYTNVDGIKICSDANKDAEDAANHLISMAKSVYGVELSSGSSVEDWGKAFLSYNRGYMYKCNGDVPYTSSPYVMNFYDNEHMNMTWISADSTDCKGGHPNSVAGKKDSNVGALAVFAYLCGGSEGSGGSSSSSEDGSDVTIIGDSITNAAKSAILEKLPQADIYAQDCKTVGYDFSGSCGSSTGENKSGLTIVKELNANGTLRDKVVFLLGTNTSGFDKLQDAISEVGSDKDVYLMSLYEVNTNHDSQNKTIKEIVEDKSNVNLIDWASKVKDNAGSYLSDSTHPNAAGQKVFAELIYNAVSVSGDTCRTGTGGFSSIEEAEAVVISAYTSTSSSDLHRLYGVILPDTGDYHDNCVAFSTWFINNYTEISYTYPPDGRRLVDDFYNRNKSKYPDMKIDSEPSVYSVASWSVPGQFTSSGNHTGIVVGINESTDTILIAEAAWNNHSFTGVHERKLSESVKNGYKYLNLNNYLKPNTGLK